MNHNHSKIQSGFVRWKCRTIYYSARGTTDGIVPTRIAVRIFSWRIIDKIFLFSWNLFWNSPTYRQLYSKIKKIESRDLDYHGNEIEKHELGNFFEKPHLNKQIKIQVHLEWCTHFKSWEIHCKQESALRITKSVWFESRPESVISIIFLPPADWTRDEEQIQESGYKFTFLQLHHFFQMKMNRIKCTCEVFSILFQNCIYASSVDERMVKFTLVHIWI